MSVGSRRGWAGIARWIPFWSLALALCACAQAVAPAYGDVPGDNGCPGRELVCNGACTDVSINPFHCGGCGIRCNAEDVCFAGACDVRCRTSTPRCGARCVTLATDRDNCGECGRVCLPSSECRAGSCEGPNEPSYSLARVSPAVWVDACGAPGARTILPRVDDESQELSLPFDVRFWGTIVASGSIVTVSINGHIVFGRAFGVRTGGTLGDMQAPNGLVAAAWTDLFTRGGICVATVGAAPTRHWVLEWSDTHLCCHDDPGMHLTFEIVLSETTGTIDLSYLDMRGAGSVTAGVESLSGSVGITVCGASRCVVNAGEHYRFTPVN